jgi:hypothetical protein
MAMVGHKDVSEDIALLVGRSLQKDPDTRLNEFRFNEDWDFVLRASRECNLHSASIGFRGEAVFLLSDEHGVWFRNLMFRNLKIALRMDTLECSQMQLNSMCHFGAFQFI